MRRRPDETPPAALDRHVAARGERIEAPRSCRLSDLAGVDRFVLLGEPGSGKSTVFAQLAAAEDTAPVAARDFVAGVRPAGRTAFIDALEEFCIGEAAHDRVADLAFALKTSGFGRWRVACRAISLPPASARLLARNAGEPEIWELEPLDPIEQLAVLVSLGEPDPDAFVDRVDDMAAGALLGNPATLKLLRTVLAAGDRPIRTRGALFDAAVEAMARETNPDLPDQPGRVVARVVEAAEQSCLILLLSARSDIWRLGTPPPGDHAVTRDDLLPAGVDTEALGFALDTPMFRGEGGSFVPAHRMVAEYLGGRALARATARTDGRRAALPLSRAMAFVCGDDDRPAPALTGLFAWFVTELAAGIHAEAALQLVRANPEAILFHGDAAMLPTPHRKALLDAAGREDPWFLGAARGSTAIGGLAGEDIAEALEAVFLDPTKSLHRRAMVLDALRAGRPVTSLQVALRGFALDTAQPEWLRRRALAAFLAGASDPARERRALMDGLAREGAATSLMLRLDLLPEMIGTNATASEVRAALVDYGASGDGVMGVAHRLTDKLTGRPLPELFDGPVPARGHDGTSRAFELDRGVAEILAATIEATAETLTTDRLLTWLENAGLQGLDPPEKVVQTAIHCWIEARAVRAGELFWGLLGRQQGAEVWQAVYDFRRLSGVAVPEDVRAAVLDRLEAAKDDADATAEVELAVQVVNPHEPLAELYWRLWHLLARRPDAAARFEAFTRSKAEHYVRFPARAKQDRSDKIAAARARDRAWLEEHEAEVRSGAAVSALIWAAEIYLGFRRDDEAKVGLEALAAWCGEALTTAINAGWEQAVAQLNLTARKLGVAAATNQTYRLSHLAAAWLDWRLEVGAAAAPPPIVALAALAGAFVLRDSGRRLRLEAAASKALLDTAAGESVLLACWRAAAPKAKDSLPHMRVFEEIGRYPADALRQLLRERPDMAPEVLADALVGAARALPVTVLRRLIARGLAKAVSAPARQVWRFAAFLLDPERHEAAFAQDMADPEIQQFFDGHNRGRLLGAFEPLTDERFERSAIIIRYLGAAHPPDEAHRGFGSDLGEVVARVIEALANNPATEAGAVLAGLQAEPALGAWSELLRHQAAQQAQRRRETAFLPPAPAAVARALMAGPPATAADLRAVIADTLRELAADIRLADTAPWRGFWNRPGGATDTPRIENDCRDLLLDRLRDRLLRFELKPRWASSEARSLDDRRTDLLFLGDGEAAVPLEAKRHFNPELWTAPEAQLLPYCRSAGSNGHGIYLIFWFGVAAAPVPPPPEGGPRIETADALRTALQRRLAADPRARLDVVVFDVSDPAAGRHGQKRRPRSRRPG